MGRVNNGTAPNEALSEAQACLTFPYLYAIVQILGFVRFCTDYEDLYDYVQQHEFVRFRASKAGNSWLTE